MKNNNFILIAGILMFLLVNVTFSQNPELVWAAQIGGTDTEDARAIKVDANGNVFTTGYFFETADFDPGPETYELTSAGLSDIFVQKLDESGNFVWAKRMGGTGRDYGRSLALDDSGNIYVTGFFHETVDFDPGPGTLNLNSEGGRDLFIQKLDNSGNLVWVKQVGGSGDADGFSIASDGSENIYLTGEFTGTVDFNPGAATFNLTSFGESDIFVQKLNDEGVLLWAKQMGSSVSDRSASITVDASGNVITTGQFNGTADFDPGPGTFNLTSAGPPDIFIQKLDASGDFEWAKRMGDVGNDWGQAITVDAQGNIYSTGGFSGVMDIDPGSGIVNITSNGNLDIYIQKLNSSGELMWAKSIGGTGEDRGLSLAVDATGQVYVSGIFDEVVDFDPGPGELNITSVGFLDIFILNLNATGDLAWAIGMGGLDEDYGYSIVVDGIGHAYTTGIFWISGDFDPGPGELNFTSDNHPDMFIQKLSDVGGSNGSNNYVLVSEEKVLLEKTIVHSGGIGLTDDDGELEISDETNITADNTFVTAPNIDIDKESQVINITALPTMPTLPDFIYNNTYPGNDQKVKIDDHEAIILTESIYEDIKVGDGATITFSGHSNVYIEELKTGKNVTILFDQGTNLIIEDKFRLGKYNYFNSGEESVFVFSEDDAELKRGSTVYAIVYTKKKLRVKKAKADQPNLLHGLFIGEEVKVLDYTELWLE